ncbi:MAG: peptide chain release factor N(5)-glutamine methyltransferase [Firmicutes bacterium]|nr:peptide chain release factor N(5)-glutamine methyltransferase [Bacillota bacterium]
MTVRECFRETEKILRGGGSEKAAAEAEYIMLEILGADRSWLFTHAADEIEGKPAESAIEAAKKRVTGEPLQYIFMRADFMGYSLYVDSRVLIPRLDTEIMASEAVKFAKHRRSQGMDTAALDLCTGSGALAMALAGCGCRVTASDISQDALDVAAANLKKYELRAELVLSDLFEALGGRSFDLIVSNPPYIPAKVVDALDPEVKDHEPRLALDGGNDGMDIIRRIIAALGEHLEPEGLAFLEIGNGQAEEVRHMAEKKGFASRSFLDFSGEQRFVCLGRDEKLLSFAK